MRALVVVSIGLLVACAAEVQVPAIVGKRDAIARSDIPKILAAARAFLVDQHHETDIVFRLRVVSHDYVQAYYGEHYGSLPPADYSSYIMVVRQHGRWTADVAKIGG